MKKIHEVKRDMLGKHGGGVGGQKLVGRRDHIPLHTCVTFSKVNIILKKGLLLCHILPPSEGLAIPTDLLRLSGLSLPTPNPLMNQNRCSENFT